MSTERDILAGRINAAIEEWDDAEPGKYAAHVAGHIADEVLSAGYRKPRTITTVEELEALSDQAVVLTNTVWLHTESARGALVWGCVGSPHIYSATDVLAGGPAVVLHEGSAS